MNYSEIGVTGTNLAKELGHHLVVLVVGIYLELENLKLCCCMGRYGMLLRVLGLRNLWGHQSMTIEEHIDG